MKRNILLSVLAAAVLAVLASCQTSLSIPYTQPSNVDMSRYRNVAVSSASRYDGYQSLPSYIRYDDSFFSPVIVFNNYPTSYSYDSVNSATAGELTRIVNKVFSSSSYYSTLSSDRTDSYTSLYRIGKDPSAMLRSDGVDALIVPKITGLRSDEYIHVDTEKNSKGEEVLIYTLYRTVDVSFSITVLDTATNRIVAMRDYRTSRSTHETFDPHFFRFTSILSQQDLVRSALSATVSDITADFIPTRRYADVTLKDNNPKNKSVEDAYKAASDGNFSYALTLFRQAYENEGHVPSGYNAALILASGGDIDGALKILSEIRESGRDDKEVDRFYSRLVTIKAKNEEAAKQYEVTEPSAAETVSPYSYLF